MARQKTPPESVLADLWGAQPFAPGTLRTVEGNVIRVLHPGRPGGRSGPDFRDAVVQIGDAAPVLGDVELHRGADDFARHGHDVDHRYDAVVLHVVFHPNEQPTTPLASGHSAPVVAVPAKVAAGPPGREPCDGVTVRLGSTAVGRFLDEAGLWRLRHKAAAMTAAVQRDGPDQALYAALAVALGQRINALPFRQLSERVPVAALAGATAGVAPDRFTAVVTATLLHAAGLDGALLTSEPALPWAIGGQRPAAAPSRRIAALAGLIVRLGLPQPAVGGTALVDAALRSGASTMLPVLTVRAADGPAYCGPARAVEVAVNALLPWAAAMAELTGDEERARSVLSLTFGLPAAERYTRVAHLDRNLRDARRRSPATSALRQQGLLALSGEWCTRGGCGRCPLS